MKKTLAMVGMVCGCACARAESGYLHFLVDQSASLTPVSFEYARVGVSGTDAYLNLKDTSTSWLLNDGTGLGTAANYATLGAYDDSAYSFYVALYDTDFTCVGTSGSFAYDLLAQYIYHPMEQSGVDATWTVSTFTVPEPTSALLMLFGCAALALRRKRGKGRLALAALCVAAGGGAFGAANDTLLTFSSVGPDAYADGTTVRDGECYALVWTRTGCTFAGLDAKGQPADTNSEIIVFAPVAKGGRCPTVAFEIDARRAERYADGSYALYLLDTRLANGTVGAMNADGKPTAVNGYGCVTQGGANTREASPAACVTAQKTIVPTDTPKPTIKSMKVVGGYVYLTVSGTLPCLQYTIRGGDAPNAANGTPLGNAANGKAGEDIILIAPATGNTGFYRVGRP